MTDATAGFFDTLARRGHDPWLENVRGSIRFDLAHDDRLDHWFVDIEDGNVSVSRDEREADCVVQIDKPVSDRLVKGETGVRAAWLRNAVNVRGRLQLLLLFERLYPGPPGARDPRQVPRTKATSREVTAAAEEDGAAATVGNLVSILESNTFVVSDSRGDMDPSPAFPTGLFSFDTRFLSTWRLSINGERLHALSLNDLEYFESEFFLVPGAPTHYVDAKVSVIRQQSVGGSFDEQLTVLNHDTRPVDLRVRVDSDSDFADVFGHLLWSGIVPADRAKKIAEHLLGPKLFSGWGVRTLASDAVRYNPVGYHTGTVWPFDNAFIAWGLHRYGLTEEAGRITQGIIDVSQYFRGRLPETFAGYNRQLTKYPVVYPNACSPYALSTGTVLLLRTMLGLNPDGNHLITEPAIPKDIGNIQLVDIPGPWGHTDAYGRSRSDVQRIAANDGGNGMVSNESTNLR